MPAIRRHPELTDARDALVKEWEATLAQLKAAATVKDLDKIIWSREYQAVTTAIAELATGVELALAEKRKRDDTEDVP